MDFRGVFASLPSAKQFDVAKKSTIMALFGEGVAAKEIAKRLKRNAVAVKKVIASNRDLKVYKMRSAESIQDGQGD